MKFRTKPALFWSFFAVLSLIAATLSFYYFPRAFPLVGINLTMDRAQAIKQAKRIALDTKLGPQEAQYSASFDSDEMVKTFVELEGGGKQALIAMMDQYLYQPYTWRVRLFKEFEPNEALIRFTPNGTPYGFSETISENTPGASLSNAQARKIAEQTITTSPWNISLSDYQLVESSQEKRPSSRIDHTFLYERPEIRIGEGFYRLRIIVSGDHVSDITHLVKVPDTFIRRYIEMRSTNATISYIAAMAFLLLYAIGGCVIGLSILFRKRWALWQKPFWWALLVAGVTGIEYLNQLPLEWMNYNTSLARSSFLINHLIAMITQSTYWFFVLFITFMAAESLTRKAFGNQLQLWRLWNSHVASSYTILGWTVAGYLLAPIALCFTTIFYIVTSSLWGWWIPSTSLFNPNILATYFPWWQSLAMSFKAGFWEECLFRAVPLACGALIGQRFGHRNFGIALAFIVQILIFGAAHANYPAQPAYARVVELIAISSLFGALYLRFGLLISIIAHFAYDVFWISLPLFVSNAQNALVNQLAVVILTLVPLWIVLVSRIRTGMWHSIPETIYNRAWYPPQEQPAVSHTISQTVVVLSPTTRTLLLSISAIGTILWITLTQWKQDGSPLKVIRTQAIQTASFNIATHGAEPTEWISLTLPLTESNQVADNYQHRFIWQEGGKEIYRILLGTYLTPPNWLARFVKFTGNIVERSEEHRAYIDPQGMAFRYQHIIPETLSGKKLTQLEAHKIAVEQIAHDFNRTADQIVDVSAVATKQPDRIDWLFTFAVPGDYPLSKGQARINVRIGGDQVLDSYQYIHVPEDYKRSQNNLKFLLMIIKQLCSMLVYLVLVIGAFLAFKNMGTVYIDMKKFYTNTIIFGLLFIGNLVNSLPTIAAYFNTSEPLMDQTLRALGISGVRAIVRAALFALAINFVNRWRSPYAMAKNYTSAIIGYGIGVTAAGIGALIDKIAPSADPTWADFDALGYSFPLFAGVVNYTVSYLMFTIIFLLYTIALTAITQNGTRYLVPASLLCMLLGICLTSTEVTAITSLLVNGIALGTFIIFVYTSFIKYDRAVIPLATAGYYALALIQQASFNAHAYAISIVICSLAVIMTISWRWYQTLSNPAI